jgi:SAM-dependent methyltransferase/predicted DsbA family dithiol-disulfide isomerase
LVVREGTRLPEAKPLIELVRFADPLSWQTWCTEPIIRRFEEVLGDGVRVTYRMGGLFENITDWMDAKGLTKEAVVSTIIEDTAAAGMPLHPDYLWQCGVKTTYTPCIAYRAAELQDVSLAHRFFRRMMEAFMVEGRPASHDEYISLGGEVGLSTSRLRHDIDIPLARDRFDADRHAMSEGGLGFDSMLIRSRSREVVRVDGFAAKPYADAIMSLEPDLPKRRPSDLLEYAERRQGILPSREIAEVFRLTEPVATERMHTLAAGGILEPQPLEAGALWRWKTRVPDPMPLDVALAAYVPKPVETDIELHRVLIAAARARYTEVAERPKSPQQFPFGPELAARVGYAREILAEVPAPALESFTGVGYVLAEGGTDSKDTVLDVGCGSGTDAILASRQLGRRGEVYGVDVVPAMVAKARSAITGAGLKRIQILEGDAGSSIPLPQGSVDVALSNGVLHTQRDKAGVLREILRVLRPGGRLRLADVVVRLSAAGTLGSDPQMWAGGLSGAPLETGLPRAIETAGFRDVRVIGDHDYYSASEPSTVHRLARAMGARTMVVEAMKPEAPRERR